MADIIILLGSDLTDCWDSDVIDDVFWLVPLFGSAFSLKSESSYNVKFVCSDVWLEVVGLSWVGPL